MMVCADGATGPASSIRFLSEANNPLDALRGKDVALHASFVVSTPVHSSSGFRRPILALGDEHESL